MDAFVSRLAADGSALLMSSYVGGSAEDFGEAITIDRLGTIYVAGTSRSADFPKQNAAQPDIGGVPSNLRNPDRNGFGYTASNS